MWLFCLAVPGDGCRFGVDWFPGFAAAGCGLVGLPAVGFEALGLAASSLIQAAFGIPS